MQLLGDRERGADAIVLDGGDILRGEPRGLGPVGVGASELPDAARELLNRAGK